jgi:hypothetical protein
MGKHYLCSCVPRTIETLTGDKEPQLGSWSILIFFKEAFAKKVAFFTRNTLLHRVFFKLLCFQMSNHFSSSFLHWSNYNNKEPQLGSWSILIFFKEAFAKKVAFFTKNTL